MFEGFSGLALKLIPILKKEDVAKRVFDAIWYKEEEVYIPWYTNILGVGMIIIRTFSERLRIKIIKVLMGDGMKTLKCRGVKKKE